MDLCSSNDERLKHYEVELLGGLFEVLYKVGNVIVVIARSGFWSTEVPRDLLEVFQVLRAQLVDDPRQKLLQLCSQVSRWNIMRDM